MVKRIKWLIFRNCFWLLYQKRKLSQCEKKNLLTIDERYQYAQKMLKRYHRMMKVTVEYTGRENIPDDLKGCLFIGNHQSPEDCPAVLTALYDTTTSFLITKDRLSNRYMGPILTFLKGKGLDMQDLRSQVSTYQEMAQEMKNGTRFIIFPEAAYDDNHNTLNEFHSPCFLPAYKSECPIIPFCLYDTWKVYEDKTLKPLTVYCHILKPIYYEEYAHLSRQELAHLVKERIQEKLDEIEKRKEEIK